MSDALTNLRKAWAMGVERRLLVRGAGALVALGVVVAAGCASHGGGGASSTKDTSDSQTAVSAESGGPLAGIFGPTPDKPGSQLWAENCTRCHYVRPPNTYSSQQWDLIMQHMRLRANLTGQEERKIAAFLKSGAGVEEE